MKIKKTTISILVIGLSILKSFGTIYTNDMDYVLGDVKQGFIQNRITSNAQCDNLLDGFEEMEVNGIRIPIFASNELTPNKPVFDYFFNEAKARGFLIFANPAQGGGGIRIANGILNGPVTSVRGDFAASQRLIDRIKEFASEYPCKWVNPFNEDGRPDSVWNIEQINQIYSSLYNEVNGAELIGPCVWGIPASIRVMNETDIRKYITVATTHNLGFNHGSWPEFISIARNLDFPVWDSEVNVAQGNGMSRLDSALANKVDGLVLYNSWNAINRNNGTVNAPNRALMSRYLKPRVQLRKRNSLGFCIDGGNGGSNGQNVRLHSYIESHPNLTWEEIDRGNGFYSYQKKGTNFSLDGGNGGDRGQNVFLWPTQPNNFNQHWRKVSAGNGHFRLQKRNATGFTIDGGSGGRNGQNVALWSFGVTSQNLEWFVEQEQE